MWCSCGKPRAPTGRPPVRSVKGKAITVSGTGAISTAQKRIGTSSYSVVHRRGSAWPIVPTGTYRRPTQRRSPSNSPHFDADRSLEVLQHSGARDKFMVDTVECWRHSVPRVKRWHNHIRYGHQRPPAIGFTAEGGTTSVLRQARRLEKDGVFRQRRRRGLDYAWQQANVLGTWRSAMSAGAAQLSNGTVRSLYACEGVVPMAGDRNGITRSAQRLLGT